MAHLATQCFSNSFQHLSWIKINGWPTTTSKARHRVIATLKRFGFDQNPMVSLAHSAAVPISRHLLSVIYKLLGTVTDTSWWSHAPSAIIQFGSFDEPI